MNPNFPYLMRKLFTYSWLVLLSWLPLVAAAQNRPDLVVVAPFTVPTTVQAGGVYTMSAVIKNQGTNGSQFNCIGYYLSADNVWDATDAYLGSSCQALLFPGQSGTCGISATIPALATTGSRYLLLVADPPNAEQESDETNNIVSFALTVTAGSGNLPDLALWRPSLSFGAVPPGGSTGAFTFIFNNGPGAVSNYEIGFYLSADTVFSATTDVFLGLVTGGSLVSSGGGAAGTIHSAPVLTVPASTPPGNYYLVLMADPRNVVAESNETNNSRALPLRVTGTTTATTAATGTSLAAYPNPVARGMAVRLTTSGNSRLEAMCYDQLGRLVSRQLLGGSTPASLDTSALPAGLYLVRVAGDQLHTSFRLQVE
jgi:hypothetical protein